VYVREVIIVEGPKRKGTPVGALFLVDLLLLPKDADGVIGDLIEGFGKRVQRYGLRKARLWCWAQALRTVGPLAWAGGKRVTGLGTVWKLAGATVDFLRGHWS
jgi:hypothetical protein